MHRLTGFSVRQLITLGVVAALGALMIPVGAYAAGQLVTIADPTSNVGARVTSGRLWVGDATGPLTVDGTIDVRYRPPSATFLLNDSLPNTTVSGTWVILTGPTSSTLAITSYHLANYFGNPGGLWVELRRVPGNTASDCGINYVDGFGTRITAAMVPPQGNYDAVFTTPVVLKGTTSDKYCVMAEANGDASNPADVSSTLGGYVISGTVPA